MDFPNSQDFILGAFLGAVIGLVFSEVWDYMRRRSERSRYDKARNLVKARGYYPARYSPKLAVKDDDLGTAMLVVASEGELLLDRHNNIAGYISTEPRGPHLRLVVSNDPVSD